MEQYFINKGYKISINNKLLKILDNYQGFNKQLVLQDKLNI